MMHNPHPATPILYCSICDQLTRHDKQQGEWVCKYYRSHLEKLQ